ncbi:MAG: hypothetical protein ACAI43_04570 [Phycisphaerae bacterium]|nr:hypothetical protein [Tepidisphaeraceae bacterium]
MIAKYVVRLTFHTADQLTEIFNYIERDSPQNAGKVIARILDAIDSLEMFP